MRNKDLFEPNAIQRQAAAEMFGMFAAFVKEGFTEEQALRLVGMMLTATAPDGDE